MPNSVCSALGLKTAQPIRSPAGSKNHGMLAMDKALVLLCNLATQRVAVPIVNLATGVAAPIVTCRSLGRVYAVPLFSTLRAFCLPSAVNIHDFKSFLSACPRHRSGRSGKAKSQQALQQWPQHQLRQSQLRPRLPIWDSGFGQWERDRWQSGCFWCGLISLNVTRL